jgi:hypothetical protein
MGQSLLRKSTLPLLLCRWRHFRENGGCGRLRSKGDRLESITVSWNDQHVQVSQGAGFEGKTKCLKVVIYRIFLGPSQRVVKIVTIFKDDGRVTANLGKPDIKIACETKFAANDAFDIIKGML